MASAKEIKIFPIDSKAAKKTVERYHYSGIQTPNAQLHFGVFLGELLEGVLSFGPSMDKNRTIGLVRATKWNGFMELNRMAFSDRLPRNSESRAISFCLRAIKKQYPHIEWIISFADATQCGDGAIYRASGFVLTQINPNKTIYSTQDGQIFTDISINTGKSTRKFKEIGYRIGESLRDFCARSGSHKLPGYQLRYVYFMNDSARQRLSCPVIPFSKIDDLMAGMYKGEKTTRGKEQAPGLHPGLGGATPTPTLQFVGGKDPGKSQCPDEDPLIYGTLENPT